MGAPGGEAVDSTIEVFAEEMSADNLWQRRQFLRGLLHEQEIRTILLDQCSDVFDRSAGPAKQIPANDSHNHKFPLTSTVWARFQ